MRATYPDLIFIELRRRVSASLSLPLVFLKNARSAAPLLTFLLVAASASIASAQQAISVNSGGGAHSPYIADKFFSGGRTSRTTAAIDLNGVVNPAPMAVYQTDRWGGDAAGNHVPFHYTFPGLTPGAIYTVRLHFAETHFTKTGEREFNVSINGTQVLANFDIVAAAGAANKAVVAEFPAMASSSGQIVIAFTVGAVNAPKVSGIQIIRATPTTCRVQAPAPAGFHITNHVIGSVSFAWTPVTPPSPACTPVTYTVYVNDKAVTTQGTTTYTAALATGGAFTSLTFFVRTNFPNSSSAPSTSVQVFEGDATPTPTPTPGTCTVQPPAPTGLHVNAVTSDSASLAWTAVNPPSQSTCAPTSYRVFRDGIPLPGTITGTTAFSDQGLSPSTTYIYTVVALFANGGAIVSGQSASVTVTTPPASACPVPAPAPTGFHATNVSFSSASFAWNSVIPPSPACNPITYTVYVDGKAVATVGTTTYSTSLAAGGPFTRLTFFVRTNFSNSTSAPSASVEEPEGDATPTPTPTPGTCTVQPPAPTGLQVSTITSDSVSLEWTAVNPPSLSTCAPTSYKVYRDGIPLSGTVPGPGFTDAGLNASTTYSYSVVALFANSGQIVSSQSASVTATTLPGTSCNILAPELTLQVTSVTSNSVSLAWTPVDTTPPACGPVAYIVFRNGAASAFVGTATTFTDQGLQPATTYSYTVVPYLQDLGETIGQSTTVSATTQ